jgi:predicted aldo/keto reductase-like oxidoreductase
MLDEVIPGSTDAAHSLDAAVVDFDGPSPCLESQDADGVVEELGNVSGTGLDSAQLEDRTERDQRDRLHDRRAGQSRETEEVIIDRFNKVQERLRTDYVDAFMMHGVAKRDMLDNAAFHAAVTKLKADGRLRFVGVSCHGPRQEGEDGMADVLVPAAEDGRFDIFLMSYNFMIKDEAEKVLAGCKKNNVATTAMKTAPGTREIPPWDPENPTGEAAEMIAQMEGQGMPREQAIAMIDAYVKDHLATLEAAKPWMEKYGVTDKKDYQKLAVKFVLSNPDMHTVCLSLGDFDAIDRVVPLSGSKLASIDHAALEQYRLAFSNSYCRHGCIECAGSCPQAIPVSTIMRYSNYFAGQGREKHAMVKYARLGGRDGSVCMSCIAPCIGACPHGVNIQANLVRAHNLLTIAEKNRNVRNDSNPRAATGY